MTEEKKLVSLIIPCYNEQESLPCLYPEIKKAADTLSNYRFEILFVDDGSADQTGSLIKQLAREDERVQYYLFSRNFGKEAAMYAGFCNARGDYVAVLDADMQDPPSLLPEMIGILEQGAYDSVATRRVDRKGEPPIRSMFARMFYKMMRRISDADIVDGARDFRLMNRNMVDAILSLSEYNRFSKGIFGWVGFRTCWLAYENRERVAGETKWNFWKLFKYSIDGIINFSQLPLSIASWSGIFLLFDDCLYHHKKAAIWRSGRGLAVSGMYYYLYRRHSAVLHGNHRAVSGKDLYGSKEKTAFYCGVYQPGRRGKNTIMTT